MTRTIVIILLIAAVIEYYSFMLVHAALAGLSGTWNSMGITAYLALTGIIWLIIPFFRKINWERIHHLVRDPFITVAMGVIVAKIIVTVFLVADDLRRSILFLVGAISDTHFSTGRSPFTIQAAVILGVVTIAGFICGMAKRYAYRIVRIKLQLHGLPEKFRGFRIVQLSDLHTGSFDNPKAVETGIRKVLEQQPDIILFTGDLVNNRAQEVTGEYKTIYSSLKAPMGVYSILGNHDYGDYVTWESPEAKKTNLMSLIATQKEMGWKLLMNKHVILERDNDRIGLIGIENWSAKSSFPQYGKLEEACAGLAEEHTGINILMSHDPSHWEAQVLQEHPEIHLTLSGHTHGMQLGIENRWFKWSPVKYAYKQWAGLYRQSEQYLYVNRGFGFLTYPGRIGIMPEITVIDLV